MLVKVKVFSGEKENKVIKKDENSFEIKTKEKPIQNRANKSIIDILASFLKISSSQIKIIKGFHKRNKILEIKN